MMQKREAYQTISKHVFLASRAYSTEYEPVVILADSGGEAMELAMKRFGTVNCRAVCLERLAPTDNEQVFEVKYVR